MPLISRQEALSGCEAHSAMSRVSSEMRDQPDYQIKLAQLLSGSDHFKTPSTTHTTQSKLAYPSILKVADKEAELEKPQNTQSKPVYPSILKVANRQVELEKPQNTQSKPVYPSTPKVAGMQVESEKLHNTQSKPVYPSTPKVTEMQVEREKIQTTQSQSVYPRTPKVAGNQVESLEKPQTTQSKSVYPSTPNVAEMLAIESPLNRNTHSQFVFLSTPKVARMQIRSAQNKNSQFQPVYHSTPKVARKQVESETPNLNYISDIFSTPKYTAKLTDCTKSNLGLAVAPAMLPLSTPILTTSPASAAKYKLQSGVPLLTSEHKNTDKCLQGHQHKHNSDTMGTDKASNARDQANAQVSMDMPAAKTWIDFVSASSKGTHHKVSLVIKLFCNIINRNYAYLVFCSQQCIMPTASVCMFASKAIK